MIRRAISCSRIGVNRSAPPTVALPLHKRWFGDVFVPADMPVVKKKWRAVEVIKTTTETMKNVAAGKLPYCEKQLAIVRPFAGIMDPFFQLDEIPEEGIGNTLHVALCTERGLCGLAGSNVPRQMGNNIKLARQSGDEGEQLVAVYGKKGMTKISGMIPSTVDQLNIGFGNVKMKDPNFTFVCETVDALDKLDWDVALVYYNTYVNSQTFRLETIPVYNQAICEAIGARQFPAYEVEGDENTLVSILREYKMATLIYHGMAEQGASEQGSRLMSMDGAVTACKEKAGEYQKIYMKLRQTKITSELTVLAAGVKCLEVS